MLWEFGGHRRRGGKDEILRRVRSAREGLGVGHLKGAEGPGGRSRRDLGAKLRGLSGDLLRCALFAVLDCEFFIRLETGRRGGG